MLLTVAVSHSTLGGGSNQCHHLYAYIEKHSHIMYTQQTCQVIIHSIDIQISNSSTIFVIIIPSYV